MGLIERFNSLTTEEMLVIYSEIDGLSCEKRSEFDKKLHDLCYCETILPRIGINYAEVDEPQNMRRLKRLAYLAVEQEFSVNSSVRS
ncbi:MAG: hypothetical protein ABIH72_05770 [archaeon]